MDTGQLLLKAILAQPREDTPRLLYADWLEETGRPEYAAFIRRQIADGSSHELRASGLRLDGAYRIPGPRNLLRKDEARVGSCVVVKRGFAADLRTRLDTFMGGLCQVCAGLGFRRLESANGSPYTGDYECSACRGFGFRPSAWIPLAVDHPLERIVLSDRFPIEGWDDSGTRRWRWASYNWVTAADSYSLIGLNRDLIPVCLGCRFAQGSFTITDGAPPTNIFYYPTVEEAVADLSQACLRYLRDYNAACEPKE